MNSTLTSIGPGWMRMTATFSGNSVTRTIVLAAILFPLLTSCATRTNYATPVLPAPREAPQYYQHKLPDSYQIRVSDKLEIRSYYDQQLNQVTQVRPDGRISLKLVGEFLAAGKTPAALTAEIKKAYDEKLENPDINVVMSEISERRMYIGGEVRTPSMQRIQESLTLMQALTLAGGVSNSANISQVLLLRNDANNELKVHQIDTDKILNNEIPDVYLSRNDVVYVPRSPIADKNIWMDQYINNMIPDFLRFNINYQLGTSESNVDQKTTIK